MGVAWHAGMHSKKSESENDYELVVNSCVLLFATIIFIIIKCWRWWKHAHESKVS